MARSRDRRRLACGLASLARLPLIEVLGDPAATGVDLH
jgi:hypothetical protein